ncbi:hypothetical protein ACJX0J_030682 [Zea mays]
MQQFCGVVFVHARSFSSNLQPETCLLYKRRIGLREPLIEIWVNRSIVVFLYIFVELVAGGYVDGYMGGYADGYMGGYSSDVYVYGEYASSVNLLKELDQNSSKGGMKNWRDPLKLGGKTSYHTKVVPMRDK